MQKNCKNCQAQFEITDEDLKFYDKISPVFDDRKYLVPPPTLCPDCRQQRRFSFRNERYLFKRKCDLCNKSMVSFFDKHVKFPVYCVDCWWSDKWDPYKYGKDFDFSRPFFDQFQDLMNSVPQAGLLQLNNENSEYNSLLAFSKNTYMSPGSYHMEDCYYVSKSEYCKNCLDSNFIDHMELASGCINCGQCYNVHNLINCKNCSGSSYMQDCRGCQNCFMCVGVVQKQYYFKNKQYTQSEYEEIKNKYKTYSEEELLNEFLEFSLKIPKKYQNQINCQNSSGDYIQNCKNAIECYDCFDVEDCKYLYGNVDVKDSMDITMHDKEIEMCYEVCSGGEKNRNMKFSFCSIAGSDSDYLYSCFYLSDSFGCDGIHNHNTNCILNKKYSQDEYYALKEKIIKYMIETKEYGEFFPTSISPHYYNESTSQDYFPMKREEALKRGYKWRDSNAKEFMKSDYSIQLDIKEMPDSILDETLSCKECNYNYKIIHQELELHRKLNVPISSYCPNCRYRRLLALKNPRKLWKRQCNKCQKDIQSTYSPDKNEIVCCEECYFKEIY